MPVLLLAQGDQEARTLLRQAIEARYGVQPPVIENLQIDFRGRARAKVGPITTWVPVDATAYFRFPTAMRWDFTVKPLGLTVRRGVEAFDGSTYRTTRGSDKPTVISDERRVSAMRQHLWAIAALLLTPLGEHFVKVQIRDARAFEATNTKLNDSVTIHLRANNTLDHVEMRALNPDSDKEQLFTIRLSEERSPVDHLMLPSKISTFWDGEAFYEIEPVRVETNPNIPDSTFTLEAEA